MGYESILIVHLSRLHPSVHVDGLQQCEGEIANGGATVRFLSYPEARSSQRASGNLF